MIKINDQQYRELRCKNDSCRQLFIYEAILVGRIAWQCNRCGTMNEYVFTMLKTKENINKIDSKLAEGGEK